MRGQCHGFQAGTADFVDGHGGYARVAAAFQCGLSRGILAQAGLHHVAEDDFVDLVARHAGAADGFGDDFCAQFWRRETG